MKDQFGEEILDKIDIEARAVFHTGATNSVIKSTYKFNHYRECHAKINTIGTINACPRCIEIESWKHVVLCHTNE